METKLILLTSVIILQIWGFVSVPTDKIIICGESKYGLEKKFTNVARYMGYVVEESPFESDLKSTLDYIYSSADVIINFNVNNPEVYYSVKELNEYDGDMIAEYYGIMDKTLPSCTDYPNQTDVYNRTCKDPGFNKYTKLFIGSFDKHQALYNMYYDITNNYLNYKRKEKKEIVVCTNPCPDIHKDGFVISCEKCDTQFSCNDNTIAIMAQSPKNLKTCDENIPVIFYDTTYVNPNNVGTVNEEQDTFDFVTSTTLIHWRALSSSLRRYLDKNFWPRVAVVSDDSLLSHYMTNDQEKYFEHAKVLFTIIRDCTEERDFKEALTFLDKFQSRVIIVNVAKHKLHKFIEGAKAADVTDADIIWVFPGHRESDIKIYEIIVLNKVGQGFKFKSFVYLTCNLRKVVEFVIGKYKESLGVETKFKEKIRDNRPFKSFGSKVKESQICSPVVESTPQPFPPMGLGNCALRISNYFHYCADWHVLYLILAIIVFLLLVFAVLLFFNHIQMNTLAYKPLHKPPSVWRQLLRRERPQPQRQGYPLRRRY